MFAILSIHTDNFNDLASLTDYTKQVYADRHGYKFLVKTKDLTSKAMGFNKIHFCRDTLDEYPEIEWLLFSECDASITNLDIKIEDRIDDNYHVIFPVDRLNINAGNFLVRNSEQGRAFLDMILSKEEEYTTNPWAEQQVIIDNFEEWSDRVQLVEQRYMNSYEPLVYDYCDASQDIFGNSAAWEPGDWIVHWPGLQHHIRIERATWHKNRIAAQ